MRVPEDQAAKVGFVEVRIESLWPAKIGHNQPLDPNVNSRVGMPMANGALVSAVWLPTTAAAAVVAQRTAMANSQVACAEVPAGESSPVEVVLDQR